jgi:hypothetical protein
MKAQAPRGKQISNATRTTEDASDDTTVMGSHNDLRGFIIRLTVPKHRGGRQKREGPCHDMSERANPGHEPPSVDGEPREVGPSKLPSTTPGAPCHVCGFSYSNRCTYMTQDAITASKVGHDLRTRPNPVRDKRADVPSERLSRRPQGRGRARPTMVSHARAEEDDRRSNPTATPTKS